MIQQLPNLYTLNRKYISLWSFMSSSRSNRNPSIRYVLLFLIFSVMVMCFSVQPLLAATYFVSKVGSNSNPGSEAQPWLTIQKAADTMVAGDTVYVLPGTYPERVIQKRSGLSDFPITYMATGVVTLGGFAVSGAYVYVSGFHLNGASVPIYGSCIQLTTGGDNCRFSNITITGIGASISQGFGGVSAVTYNAYFDNITITNPNYHAFILTQSGHTVKNCTVNMDTGWDVFRIVSSNTLISGCTISASNTYSNPQHADIFQGFGDNYNVSQNVTIENNIILNGYNYQFGMLTDDQLNGDISKWTFRNNIVANVTNCFNLYAPDVSFYNNTFYRVGATSNWVIIYNASSNAGYAYNLKIKNNMFVECGAASIATKGWYGGASLPGQEFDYNLVVGVGAGTSKTGFNETHGLNGVDPLFVSPADLNFRLRNGSPAIASGENLYSVFSYDLFGVLRNNTLPWDRGAIAFSSQSPGAPLGLKIRP